ncbi:MAG: helix-turn-helix domain-containing protein [Acholeplasmataceae bacterium]|nr:helix-turn-helix domain-containing protein [Acholeplasmataceae bacterium]
MELSEFIKDVRFMLELSQNELAKALNVSFSSINRWENKRVVPSNLALKTFFEFCDGNFIDIPIELRDYKAR